MEIDLLNVDPALEATQHKLKRQVQSPDSFFMDVKCPMCHTVTTVYSNKTTINTLYNLIIYKQVSRPCSFQFYCSYQ